MILLSSSFFFNFNFNSFFLSLFFIVFEEKFVCFEIWIWIIFFEKLDHQSENDVMEFLSEYSFF